MSLESYRDQQDTKEKQESGTKKELTTVEILQDPQKSKLFGMMLERNGEDALAKRILEKDLDGYDVSILDIHRINFSEAMEESSFVNNNINKKTLEYFSSQNEGFKKCLMTIGNEKMQALLTKNMQELSITDPDRFSSIFANMEALDQYKKGEMKETEDAIAKFCEERGIDVKTYYQAIGERDTEERNKKLQEIAKEKVGFFKSIFGGRKKFVKEMLRNRNDVENAIAELKEHESRVGESLAMTLTGNEELRNAMAHELVNEKQMKEEKLSFVEMKEANKTYTEENALAGWATFKTSNNWDTLAPAEQEQLKDTFVEQVNKQIEGTKKKGFWFQIFKGFSDLFTAGLKAKLQ